jgi:hypothetical protein
MSYLNDQLGKVLEDNDHGFKFKLMGKNGSTHWLNLTDIEAQSIFNMLKQNNYDERVF